MAEISLSGLSFTYPGSSAPTLSSLDLRVARGEAHALLGSSGAGKTTLLNLLSGLLPADPGQIVFDGADVGGLPPWQRGVTQVFQFPVLYEAMTVAENLTFPMRRVPAAERASRLADIAVRLGIDDVLGKRTAALTLVQKQLAAIGKALMRPDASLVLLDEPLTAAAPEHKWQLRQTLKALQHDLGATMIYVTHDQTEALTFADRVSVLHEGRILQTDTPRALIENPAHEHVGYFVGSPGMNLLDGVISGGECRVGSVLLGTMALADGPCRFGFRPEWAEVSGDGPVAGRASEAGGASVAGEAPVVIRSTRTLSTLRGRPHGLVYAEIAGCPVVTRQALTNAAGHALSGGPGRLSVQAGRLCCFRNGAREVA